MLLKQSTARNRMVLMVNSTDHVTGMTGLTLVITAGKDGGALASITPVVTERGNGWYSLALTAGMVDTLGDLALHITGDTSPPGTDPDPTDLVDQVVTALPGEELATVIAAIADVPTAVENADALLGRNIAGGSSSGRLVKDALRFLRNKWTLVLGVLTVYQEDDTTPAWTGNVTSNASAEPVTGNDPT